MYTVFFVDDEHWALYGIRNSFDWEGLGFQIVGEATDPGIALVSIEKLKPDVVFVDIKMPNMTGIELIKEARVRGVESEFVIVSGFAEFEYAKDALKLGVFNYLLKPIDIEEGLDVIKKMLIFLKKKSDMQLTRGLQILDVDVQDLNLSMNKSFKSLLEYVNSNFDQELYLNELSKKFYLHHSYICELFKKHTGKTFSKYVLNLRLNKACELLRSTDLTVGLIAQHVGLDGIYFNLLFKKELGQTPTCYRKGDGIEVSVQS